MQRREHPFFSKTGCGAAFLLALVLAAFVYARGGAPFSPGPLAQAPQSARMPGTSAINSDFQSHAAFEDACAQCHVPWRGISAERCEECHTGIAEQRLSGSGLHGTWGDTARCTGCHTEHEGRSASLTSIRMADVERFHTFPLDHGEEGVQACAVCHEQTFTTYTCYNCHEHEPAEIREEHLDEGIREFENCVECHPTGLEDEAEDD